MYHIWLRQWVKGHLGFEILQDRLICGSRLQLQHKGKKSLYFDWSMYNSCICSSDGPPDQTGNSRFVPCTLGSKIKTATEDTHHTGLQGFIFSVDSVIRWSH